MTNAEIEKRVEELLSQMTLEEKIGQMNQAGMPPEEREDTKELYEKYDIEGKINFIIGTDAFKKIESWYESDKLKDMLDFILFAREGEKELEADATYLQNLREKGYNYKMMTLPFMDISSTKIRENIYNSVPIQKLVPAEVEKYIDKYGLYRK